MRDTFSKLSTSCLFYKISCKLNLQKLHFDPSTTTIVSHYYSKRILLRIKHWWSGGLEWGLIIKVINSRVSRKFFTDVISSTYECAMMQWGLYIDSDKNEKEKNQLPSSMAIYCFLKYTKRSWHHHMNCWTFYLFFCAVAHKKCA